MRCLMYVVLSLVSVLGSASAEGQTPPEPKREYIQVEVAPKGSPPGTKGSWDKGKPMPPKPIKRRIREVLGFE